jgi:2-methylcitrate dehydratase PrpD
MDAEARVAEFVATTRWEDLPEPVRWKAKMCLVDNLGATLVGTLTRVSRIGAAWAAAAHPGDACTMLLRGARAAPAGAAFANGCAANGLDTDDAARYAYGHAGAQIFPTALALAEALELDGARLLAATVVGYEVAHRIGRCWHDHHSVYQACGSWGSVACAAVAANLMALPPDQARHALGIAEYHAPNLPMMRDVDDPGMVKHGIGWAAMNGVISAALAKRGFTGIPTLLSFEQYRDWVGDIGSDYLMVDGVSWKAERYACCGWAHAAVEGAYRLAKAHDIDVKQIARIQVEAFHETARLGTKLPTTTEEAQFNLAWPVAAMLVDGEVGPGQTLESRLSDPEIRGLARKVEVVESEELNELRRLFERGDPLGRFASKVTLVMEDGRAYHSGLVDGGLRFPQTGWDKGVMESKFRWLVGNVLNQARVEDLLETAWRFDELADVGEFARRLG